MLQIHVLFNRKVIQIHIIEIASFENNFVLKKFISDMYHDLLVKQES